MKPLDKEAEIHKTRRNLPHWEQTGCTYFITWRLADSLPAVKLQEWKAARARWLAAHPEPWTPEVRAQYHREITARIERWLDAGHGACVLRRPDARGIVARALHHFDGQRYVLDGCVIMPNHVHVLVTPQCDTGFPACDPSDPQPGKAGALSQAGKPVSHSLSAILQSWKGYSAREINRLLGQRGQLWMDENFDHAVRSSEQFAHFQRYLRENPVKARLRADEFYLWQRESDTAFPGCDVPRSQAEKPVSHSR